MVAHFREAFLLSLVQIFLEFNATIRKMSVSKRQGFRLSRSSKTLRPFPLSVSLAVILLQIRPITWLLLRVTSAI